MLLILDDKKNLPLWRWWYPYKATQCNTYDNQKIEGSMKACLAKLKVVADIGFVGGSDQKKIR